VLIITRLYSIDQSNGRICATDPPSIDALLRAKMTSKPSGAEEGRSAGDLEMIGGGALAFHVARILGDSSEGSRL